MVCRRLMTIPGVGAVVAMTFNRGRPARTFRTLQGRDAHFGLTPRKYQSVRSIGPAGSARSRMPWCGPLFEATNVMLTRMIRLSTLKAWALRVASRQGMKKAKVALARKLAVVMHRMWVDGTTFRWGKAGVTVAAWKPAARPSIVPARRGGPVVGTRMDQTEAANPR